MVVVEVDVVGAQPFERRLQRAAHVVPRSLRALAHPELGREHDLIATPFEDLAEETLALAAPVDVRRVEEVDPFLERALDDGPRPVEVEAAAEVVAAEPDPRDLDAARPELVHPHLGILHR